MAPQNLSLNFILIDLRLLLPGILQKQMQILFERRHFKSRPKRILIGKVPVKMHTQVEITQPRLKNKKFTMNEKKTTGVV